MAKKKPRYYQENGFKWTLESWEQKEIPICVLPGGGGKTLLVAMLMGPFVEKAKPVVYVAHRTELIRQTSIKLSEDGGIQKDEIGLLMGGEPRRPERLVQVASIQTLARMKELPDFAGIFIDEGHRASADTYRELLVRFPRAKVAGFTATPSRLNGAPLSSVYTKLIEIEKMSVLIKKGYLTSPLCYSDAEELLPKLEKLRKTAGDFDVNELANRMNQPKLVGGILDNYLRVARGRQFVCFASSLDHSRELVKQFNLAGVPCAHLDGKTPAEERKEIIEAFRSGKLLGICNYDILSEGFDLPACRVCIMARPTMSYVKFQQQAARVMRPYNDETSILLDHALNIGRFFFPDIDRKFSLEKGLEKEPGGMGTKTCPCCRLVVPMVTQECPGCGHPFKREERRQLEEKEKELQELKREGIAKERARIEAIAKKNKYPKEFVDKYMKSWCEVRGYQE